MTRVVFEDTHEEPLAGYNTLRVEDDHGELLVEAHLDPDVVLAVDEMLTDPESWESIATVASAYADVFDEARAGNSHRPSDESVAPGKDGGRP